MVISRRGLSAVLAAGLAPGKLLAADGLERLEVFARPRPPLDFSLHDAEGGEVRADAFRGRGLVLNFWATWCPPCIREMPALANLAAALADQRVGVVAASQDRGGAPVVQAFYARNGIHGLAVWLDPRGAAGRVFGVPGLPTTLILDAEGREVARLLGAAEWDKPAAIAAVRRLAAPAADAPRPAGG